MYPCFPVNVKQKNIKSFILGLTEKTEYVFHRTYSKTSSENDSKSFDRQKRSVDSNFIVSAILQRKPWNTGFFVFVAQKKRKHRETMRQDLWFADESRTRLSINCQVCFEEKW